MYAVFINNKHTYNNLNNFLFSSYVDALRFCQTLQAYPKKGTLGHMSEIKKVDVKPRKV